HASPNRQASLELDVPDVHGPAAGSDVDVDTLRPVAGRRYGQDVGARRHRLHPEASIRARFGAQQVAERPRGGLAVDLLHGDTPRHRLRPGDEPPDYDSALVDD